MRQRASTSAAGQRHGGATVVICAVLLFRALPAHALDGFALEVALGSSWASHWSPHDKPPGTQVVVGWQLGLLSSVSASARLGRWFTAELGLAYAEKGAHHMVTTASFPFGAMELTYRFRYIEVPVVMRTYWLKAGPGRFFTYGGAYAAVVGSTKYTFHNERKGTATRSLFDVNRGDAGFVSGFGYEVTLGRISVAVKYRYSMGFVDLELNTDPVYIPEFRGVDFPVILLRNYSHAVVTGVRYQLR